MVAGKTERIPPAAVDVDRIRDIERHLIGACLWSGVHDSDGFDEAAELVAPADFAVHAHGVVFRVMLGLRETNAPVNAATVYERLRATGQAAELGDDPRVWIADTVTLQGNDLGAGHYARQVRDASRSRALRRAVHAMSGVVLDTARPTADLLAECEQLLFDAGAAGPADQQRTAAELTTEVLDHIDRVASGEQALGVATGFADLDALTGGLAPGNVVVLAARTSVGKTALSLAIATNATHAGEPTLFVSLEMSRLEIMQRILSMRSGVRLKLIQAARLDPGQVARVRAAADQFAREPFHLDTTSPMSAARLASIVRRAVRRYGLKLLVVDYLSQIEPEDATAPRVQQIGLISRRLKQLARSCGIPVLLLAQLNRQVEGRSDGKPKLSDLRDSGDIEQDADFCFLLSRQKNQSNDDPVHLIDVDVAKARNGATGEITLAYNRPVVRFENAHEC